MYRKQLAIVNPLIGQALDACSGVSESNEPTGDVELVGMDPVRLPRAEVTEIDSALAAVLGEQQVRQDQGQTTLVVMSTDHVGVSRVAAPATSGSAPRAYQDGDAWRLENDHFTFAIESGRITSLYDRVEDRELILAGSTVKTGGLVTYDDFPLAYDAWDAEIYHLDCSHEISFGEVRVVAEGPLRASLEAVARFGKSIVTMTVSYLWGRRGDAI